MKQRAFPPKKFFFLCILSLVLFLFYTLAPAVLLLILPGLLIVYHPLAKKWDITTTVVLIVTLSLASTIILFNLLAFIPLSFTQALHALFAFSFVGLLYAECKFKRAKIQLSWPSVLAFLALLPLFWLFGRIYFLQIVPGGADMATHSYVAKTIKYHDDYPDSYYPIIPVDGFGFQPTGMPSIMAAISLLSDTPVYRTSLLGTVLIYPFLGLALFAFLRNFFPWWAGIVTAYYAVVGNPNIIGYLNWGAHPTIFAILLLLIGVLFSFSAIQSKHFTYSSSLIVALLFSASFFTHPIPFLSAAYILSIPIIFLLYRNNHHTHLKRSFAVTGILALFFISPFLLSIKPISQTTYSYLKTTMAEARSYLVYSPEGERLTRTLTLFDFPEYTLGKIGRIWFIVVLAGFLITLTRKEKEAPWILLALFLFILLIANSQHWLLPFSAALLPGRIFSTGIILFAYFFAAAIEKAGTSLSSFFNYKKRTRRNIFLLHFALLFLMLPSTARFFWKMAADEYHNALKLSQSTALVTENDLTVLQWIKENTTEQDVIQNNYGDAGVWIPAISERLVLNNDASPHLFDALGEGQQELQPTYAFIGDKLVYPGNTPASREAIERSSEYHLIFQSGASRLYKKVLPENKGQSVSPLLIEE